MTVSFFQRNRTVQARLSDGKNNCLRLSTGIRIPSHLKFDGRFWGASSDASILNNELDRFKVRLIDSYHASFGNFERVRQDMTPEPPLVDDESTDLVNLLNRYLAMAERGEIGRKRLAEKTIKNYRNAVDAFGRFAKFAGSLDLSQMSVNPKDSLKTKRDITARWDRYWRAFDNFLIDEKYAMASRSTYLTAISLIVNHWKEALFLQLPKIVSYQASANPVVVLEPEFVNKFLTKTSYDSLSSRLRFTWEVCATILITTMRADDAIRLSPEDLTESNGEMFLSKMNGKTREYTDVPIPKLLADVYRANIAARGKVYCIDGDYWTVRAHIKSLFALYQEMSKRVSIKRIGVSGEEVVKTAPMFEHVHPHMLRKTAITTMIYYGVNERHIKFLTGHSQKSAAFERYVAFVDKHFKSEVNSFYKAFLND